MFHPSLEFHQLQLVYFLFPLLNYLHCPLPEFLHHYFLHLLLLLPRLVVLHFLLLLHLVFRFVHRLACLQYMIMFHVFFIYFHLVHYFFFLIYDNFSRNFDISSSISSIPVCTSENEISLPSNSLIASFTSCTFDCLLFNSFSFFGDISFSSFSMLSNSFNTLLLFLYLSFCFSYSLLFF